MELIMRPTILFEATCTTGTDEKSVSAPACMHLNDNCQLAVLRASKRTMREHLLRPCCSGGCQARCRKERLALGDL